MGKRKNSTVKERKQILKELGLTADDMVRFWNECVGLNPIITNLNNSGLTWEDLTGHQIRQLPTLKEVTSKHLKEVEEKEEARKKAAEEAEAYKQYYREHLDEILLKKIDDREELTEEELSLLVHCHEVYSNYGSNERWTRPVSTIVEIGDRKFCIHWMEALTECQEDEFMEQPFEVVEREREIVTIQTYYESKNGKQIINGRSREKEREA